MVKDYRNHATDTIPATFFTVMAWMGAQMVIEELLKKYSPGYERWIIGSIEILIATIGLWYFTRGNSKKKK